MKRVIIIGGGISGLSTAFWLRQQGVNVKLLERDERTGGLVRSERVGGFLLDHAANCMFNYLPEVNFLCNFVGLAPKQVFREESARKRYLIKDGKPTAAPMSLRQFLTSDLWSLKAKARLMMEPLIPRGATSAAGQETVAQFISRRFGKEIFERSIEPYIAGTLAGDADKCCVKSTFRQFSEMEEQYGSILKGIIKRKLSGVRTSCSVQVSSFKEGMEELPRAITSYLGDDCITDYDVSAIEKAGNGWIVRSENSGKVESYCGDALILATPAQTAGKLLGTVDREISMLLKGVEYSPMVAAFLGFSEDDVEHDLDGIGCLFPRQEKGFSTLGSIWSSTLFKGRSQKKELLLTNYMGAARNPEMIDKSDDEIISTCLEDLGRIIGVKGSPIMAKIVRHEKALPQYNIGHQMFLDQLEKGLAKVPGLFVTGNYLKGVSIRECIVQGKEVAHKVCDMLESMGEKEAKEEAELEETQASNNATETDYIFPTKPEHHTVIH